MDIYAETSYKQILYDVLSEKKQNISKRYTFQRMADTCGMQKTFLSRVLKHDGHLTEDQLYMACQFLGFTAAESEFMQLLLAAEKTLLAERRKEIERRINSIRQAQLRTEKRIKVSTTEPKSSTLTEYYLDPYFQIIHMFLSIERFAKNPMTIASQLKISERRLTMYLSSLERMGLISMEKSKYKLTENNLHLPDSSPIYGAYRTLLRMKANEKLAAAEIENHEGSGSHGTNGGHVTNGGQGANRGQAANYSFSAFFSSTPEVRRRIQDRFLDLLKDAQAAALSDSEEQVYQMNFDLLSWSEG